MPKFMKDVLAPKRHHVGGGLFYDVPAADLETYAKNFKSMRAAGHMVPITWEHPPIDGVSGMPQLSTGYDKLAASVKHTAGYVEDMAVKDGKLVARLNIPNPNDAAKVKSGVIRGVSPRLCSQKWTDGLGRVWEKFVGHVALTNFPRDSGQGKFAPLQLSMHAGSVGMVDLADDEAGEWAELADEMDEPQSEDAKPEVTVDAPVDTTADADFEAVVAHLKEHGISLPSSTKRETFVEALLPALMTLTETKRKLAEESNAGDDQGPDAPIQTESAMQFSSHPFYAELLKTKREALAEKIAAGVKAGKLPPVVGEKLKAMAGTVQLSSSGGLIGAMPLTSVVDLFTSSLPAGAVLDLSAAKPIDHHKREFLQGDDATVKAREDAAADRCVPPKKA